VIFIGSLNQFVEAYKLFLIKLFIFLNSDQCLIFINNIVLIITKLKLLMMQ